MMGGERSGGGMMHKDATRQVVVTEVAARR